MVVIRVPMELLSKEKSLDFEMHFDVAKKEIAVVEIFNFETGDKIGPASFETG